MTAPSRQTVANLVVVTFVTLLIWFWAAGETRETQVAFTEIRFETPNQVIVNPQSVPSIELRLRGPLRAVLEASEQLRTAINVVVGSPGVPDSTGKHLIDLTSLVRTHVENTQDPVQVVSTEPETLEIEVTRLAQRVIKIEPRLPEGVKTTGRVEVVPEEGTILLPQALAESDTAITLVAEVSAAVLAKLEPGRRHAVPANVTLGNNLGDLGGSVQFSPGVVEVSVALVSAEREHTLSVVPIQVAGPPTDLERYMVTIPSGKEFLREVTLRGQPEAIRRIADGEVSVAAFVHLTSDDLVQHVAERPVSMWMLPSGVRVVRIGTSATTTPRIPLEITDRPVAP
ncbi:MAG: hypothetical protein MK085_08090 [Phycisphaerales bacterium]|nr:hypothetical protein [Phycisphaerales bacterium]